jgi:glutamate dehydrogenase/leucine dehydrogenase
MAPSFYESVAHYVDRAATLLELEEDVRVLLAEPYRQIDVQVPIHSDDGSVLSFRGYRVQHNGARAVRSRVVCGSTKTLTSTKYERWPH